MRLSELLEEQSLKSISLKTMISEDNIQRIISEDYSDLAKAKALGFLSILEREYDLDLKDVRNNAITYFEMHTEGEESVNIALPRVEEKKGKPKWLFFVMLGLLGYASWYFFTQFDKKTLNTLIPFPSEQNTSKVDKKEEKGVFSVAINEDTTADMGVVTSDNVMPASNEESTEEKNSVIANKHNISSVPQTVVVSELPTVETKPVEANQTDETNISKDNAVEKVIETNVSSEMNITTPIEKNEENISERINTVESKTLSKILIKPAKRLWFGLVNMRTGKRDHFSIRKPFTVDLSKGNWLVATSPAPFSLVFNNKVQSYKNGRAHYFMMTKSGIVPLKKRAYVKKGGYRKW